jgi:hypothetical protein
MDDEDEVCKKPKLDVLLGKCTKEDISDRDVSQPLYIDDGEEAVKCTWCPDWKGSIQAKIINQHVKTSASHRNARIRYLKLTDTNAQGQQLDIRSFFA